MVVLGLLREFHRATRQGPFNAARCEALFRAHMDRGLVLMLGSVGVLMAAIAEDPFDGGRIAKETAWFIASGARGKGWRQMLDAYEAWARDQGCDAVAMACLPSLNLRPMFERRGYAPAETHFLKPL